MPVRYLSDPQLARLSSWPGEIADEDAVTFFTLSEADLSWLAGFNRDENRLGIAVQLCTLPVAGLDSRRPARTARCRRLPASRRRWRSAPRRRAKCWRPTAAGRAGPAASTVPRC